MNNWKIQNSKYLVSDKWLKLRADSCLTEEGKVIEPYYILEYKDWVNCLVIDSEFNAILVRQYRHGIQTDVLEIIGGAVEDNDRSIEEGIKRELEEELGYIGGQIFETGVTYANPANQTNKVYSFLAFGGKISQAQQLEESETLEIQIMKFEELLELINKKIEVFQSIHIASIFYAINFIKNSDNNELKNLKIIIQKFK